MSGIPYNKLQTIDCTAKKEDGESATIAVLHYAFVIPCRDCRHYEEYVGSCTRRYHHFGVEPDGFCAWAERRDA